MRRPASRRPPKLPDAEPLAPAVERHLSPRQQLRHQHVIGTHAGFGRAELRSRLRRVVAGEPDALLGLDPFPDATMDTVLAAITEHLGYEERGANVGINGDVAIERTRAGVERIRAVARHDGTVAFATSRPASMLGIMQALACIAEIEGGHVPSLTRTSAFRADGRSNRRIWWYGGVAAVSDGDAIIPVRRADAAEEWLFLSGRPDLVVADGAFAGVALATGIETVAFADLDDAALALAIDDGLPGTLIPVDTSRPPMGYAALLLPVLDRGDARRDAPGNPPEATPTPI